MLSVSANFAAIACRIFTWLSGQFAIIRPSKRWLVGGLEHFLFSIIYGIILPIDFHIFQDGYCTTNQMMFSAFWSSMDSSRIPPLRRPFATWIGMLMNDEAYSEWSKLWHPVATPRSYSMVPELKEIWNTSEMVRSRIFNWEILREICKPCLVAEWIDFNPYMEELS